MCPPTPPRLVFAYISANTCMNELKKLPNIILEKVQCAFYPIKLFAKRNEMEMGRNTRIS